MRIHILIGLFICLLTGGFGVSSCINNDIPYPVIPMQITAFKVDGQLGNAVIDNSNSYAVRPETGEVFMEPYKYLTNFLQMPVVLLVFLVGGCALGHYPHAVEAGIRQGYLVCRCRDGAYGIGIAACGIFQTD